MVVVIVFALLIAAGIASVLGLVADSRDPAYNLGPVIGAQGANDQPTARAASMRELVPAACTAGTEGRP